jgi:Zn-dependent peptidase ImmA (M78 family)/DNA-binding XRE family transcriptional regulator
VEDMLRKAFNGAQLKAARQYRGWTADELAQRMEVSKQSISHYETGSVTPEPDKVLLMANVLHFPYSYFMVAPRVTMQSRATYFRAQMTTSKKYRIEQIRKMDHLSAIYTMIEEYVEFPAYGLPDFSDCDDEPEQIAQRLRAELGIDSKPIKDIIPFLEGKGIIVTMFQTDTDKIDAFSHRVDLAMGSVYIIALSANKESATRKHFDIAHELGHIVMHGWSDDVEAFSREEFREREREANEFAAAFLLPKAAFSADVGDVPNKLDHYIELKRKWKVSISAMIMRAYHLGLVSYNQYQYMMKTMAMNGWRTHEPLDDTLQTAPPSMLKNAMELLFDEDVFTVEEFMQELEAFGFPMESRDIEILLGLNQGFLAYEPAQPKTNILQLKPRAERR